MKKLCLFLLLSLPLAAQVPCGTNGQFTAIGVSNVINNTVNQCYVWRVSYTTQGLSALSVQLESSPDGTTWSAFSGTEVTDGANPNTTIDAGLIGVKATGAFVRLHLTAKTGSGTVTYRVWGANSASVAGLANGGSGGGFANPMTTLGDMIYEDSTPAANRVAGNTTASLECLLQIGDGTFSASPYWDTCPTQANATYYFTDTASSPTATYLQMTAMHPAVLASLSHAGVASNAVLNNFATNAGTPGVTTIPPGAFDCHVRSYKAGGSTTTLYCEIWEVSATEVDIARIGTTEQSPPLTTFETGYDLHYIQNGTYTLTSSASRIVARVWENSVAAPTIVLTVGGTSDAHLELPSNTLDITNFVPYTGATTNVALGVNGITGAPFTGDSGAGGTTGLVTSPAAGDFASGKFLNAGGTWTVPPGTGAISPPVTFTDIATPAAPAPGNTKWYTKGGKLCAEDSTSTETCTGSAASVSKYILQSYSNASMSPYTYYVAIDGGTENATDAGSMGDYILTTGVLR